MPPLPLAFELDPPPDPWESARRFAHQDHLLFFDSSGGSEELTRHSYVAADPIAWRRVTRRAGPSPFGLLRQEELARRRTEPIPGLPPFQGGIAGLFGYGLGHWIEQVPGGRRPEWPPLEIKGDLEVGVFDWVIAWDHAAHRAWIISTGWTPGADQPDAARARRRLDSVREILSGRLRPARPAAERRAPPALRHPLPGCGDVVSNFDRSGFEAAIRRAIEYTHAGDCFQVNIAQHLATPLREHPLELYGRLRQVNPAPFAGYLDGGGFQIVSASPERFIEMSAAGRIETRPIKGTRPRGATPEQDRLLREELQASAKDRAENVMIVDLLRNDLGRVCVYGSVAVDSLCQLESYPTVHHLVSVVSGQLRPGLTAVDLLRAAFPGGSVTGAPKVRALEIIAELEPHPRGAYCGSLGWLSFTGAMDTSILIRTFTAAGGWLQFPVGSGIVADSDPAREYEETLHKAAGLLRALRPREPGDDS